jgi:hypothetical protein
LGFSNVSGVVRNRVDVPLDVSVGVMQRIWGGSEPGRRGSEVVCRGSEPGRRVVGRIRWGCTTYPGWFGTYPTGLYNVSVGVMQRIWGGSEPGRRGSEVVGRGSEPGRRVVGRIRWGCTTYPLGLHNVSGVVRDVSDAVWR